MSAVGTVSRVHRRHLGSALQASTLQLGTGLLPYDTVMFSGHVRAAWLRHLASAGRWRGGLLFGHVQDDTLHLDVAAPAGYPWWAPDLFEGDAKYTLGWADALQATAPHLDWVASWVMAPDSALPTPGQCEALLTAGRRTGVFTDSYPLVAVGRLDEVMHASILRWVDGVATTLTLPVQS